jgi:outer membrane lipoprotein-sorting protein
MKTLVLIPLLLVSLLVVSCSKSETTDPAADLSANQKMVSTGDWKVTQYLDSGKDETSDFSLLSVSFNADGSIVVSDGTTTYTGTWTLASASSSSDDTGYDDKNHKFTITIAGDKLMQKLSKKWLAVKVTETEIWLSDDNPASNEHLHFGK